MIRRSLIALSLLALSLAGTYFFIELPEYKSLVESSRKVFFLKNLEILKIHFPNFILERRSSHPGWVNPGDLDNEIDEEKVKVFISRLRKLKIIKKLKNDYSYNLSSKIKLETPDKKIVELKLGDKQSFSERFYVGFRDGDKEEIYLVQDTSPQVEAIPDYLFNINPLKHRALLVGFKSNDTDWVFDGIIRIKPKKIKYVKQNAPIFSINVNSYGLSSNSLRNNTARVDSDKVEQWFGKFYQLRARQNLKNWKGINKRYIGKILFDDEPSGINVYVESSAGKEVYLQKDEIHFKVRNLIKVFSIDDFKTIFPHVQDFIDKKFLPYTKGIQYHIKFISKENHSYDLFARPLNEKLKIESTGISEKKLTVFSEMTKKLFSDANYLNFGNELTIKPEVSLKMEINQKVYDYAYAHGVLEIFDYQNKMSFFYQDHQIKDYINEARL